MALNVGINVVEVDGRAPAIIAAAPTSVAAFVGVTERGVPNVPVHISSPQQFQSRFGNYLASSYLGYAVGGFFLNGGFEAYTVRVVGAAATAAFAVLNNRLATPTPALRIAAGFRGRTDPGAWGGRVRVDVRDDPRGITGLQVAAPANATSAQLQSLSGFQIGSVLRFVDGGSTFYRRIASVAATTRTVTWAATAPIAPGLASTTAVTSAEFRITVRYRSDPTSDFAVVEDWRNLSMEIDSADYAVSQINDTFTGSQYVTVTDLSGATASGDKNPAVTSNQALNNGVDAAPAASDFTGSAAVKTGFFALDIATVQLLVVPDAHRLSAANRDAVFRGALDYCALRGDCTFVASAPNRAAPASVTPRVLADYTELESDYANRIKQFSAPFQAAKVYGAVYAGWIQVTDPIATGTAPTLFIPADGHVLGVYARTDQERGIWKAPAGSGAVVRGAQAMCAAFTDLQHTDLVRNGLVNGIRFQDGTGIIVAASRTLSSDTRWWFVSTRLLFNFVKSSLRDGLRFVRQEPNSGELRRTVSLNVVRPFLLNLWRRGAFGSDPPDKVFTIKCDGENNPPEEVNQGNFRIEVYFYAVRPAETIVIVVGQQPTGATAGEG
jgi:phage tail sheath protein FI